MTEHIRYALNVVGPIFLIILLGYIFRRNKLIDEGFVGTSNVLVFYAALPAHMFLSMVRADLREVVSGTTLAVIVISMLIIFVLSLAISFRSPLRGAFVQAAGKSNMALIGMAVVHSALGGHGSAIAAPLAAVLIPLYNMLALIVLMQGRGGNFARQAVKIITNPLLVSIFLGVIVSVLDISLPRIVMGGIELLARISLPLALLGIGGSLELHVRTRYPGMLAAAVIMKTVLLPLITVTIGLAAGLGPAALTVVFIFSASPTAVSSFAMASATGNDETFTASAIVLTTLVSLFTFSIGLVVLQLLV